MKTIVGEWKQRIISGSFKVPANFGNNGFPGSLTNISTPEDLVSVLKSGSYSLIET